MNARIHCLAAASLVLLLSAPGARAGEGVCDHCGCSAGVHKVCVPKKIEKEITKVCWSYKCEDVCIPGPSKKCDVKCGEDECGCWSFNVWEPTCARVKSHRVPVKTEVKRKVPAVEWVVEYRCTSCCNSDSVEAKSPGPQIQPPGPRPNAGQ